ncbi:MAG: hypothetical protein F7C34_01015 [Desulfurococcales archaeon]|nr:hypothetical protein [Desulfurococcales archaeon]
MGRESALDNTIIDGLDDLYTAFAKASHLSQDDPDWLIVVERLYYAMNELERAVKLLASAGAHLASSSLKQMLRRVEERVSSRDLVGATSVSGEIERVARRIRTLNNIYSVHLCAYRVVTGLSVTLAALLLPMQGLASAFLALLSVSLAIAGVMGCYEKWSILIIIVSITIPYIISIAHLLIEASGLSILEYASLLTAWLGGIALYVESRRVAELYYDTISSMHSM